ncbi:MAG: hypothetical protein AAFR77_15280 [Cyanobacteria bacterium J06631_2]
MKLTTLLAATSFISMIGLNSLIKASMANDTLNLNYIPQSQTIKDFNIKVDLEIKQLNMPRDFEHLETNVELPVEQIDKNTSITSQEDPDFDTTDAK